MNNKKSRVRHDTTAQRGSEARIDSPPPIKRSRLTWLLYIIFWAMLVGSFGWLAMMQAAEYSELRGELARIEADTQRAEEQYEQLRRQIAFIGSDEYIIQQARQRLGMVLPTELMFVNVGN